MAEDRPKKKSSGLIYKIIILILLVVIGFSLYKIGTIAYGYFVGRSTYDSIAEFAGAEKGRDDVEIKFKKLMKKYPDVKAWLYSKGTIINYPVAQGKDNDWYLHHTLDGKWNGAGTLFIDENNKKPFDEFLTIIYGHHMRDGSMFGSLVKYRDAEYYKKHKVLKLYTPDKNYEIHVIAGCTIPGDSDRYKFDFEDDEDKQEYLDWMSQYNEVAAEEAATVGDRIVMLSTCTYEFDDARFVLFGVLK